VTMKVEQDIRGARWWINGRRVGAGLLGAIVLSAVVCGPWGLLAYAAGLLKSFLLLLLLLLLGLAGWLTLLLVACIRCVRSLRARCKITAAFWSVIAFGVVLVFALQIMRMEAVPTRYFAEGFLRRMEIRTNMDAVQSWVASLSPGDCRDDRPGRAKAGRHLGEEEQPQVLNRQNGRVNLELDAQGRPRVRLSWYEGKGGTWGLVIGSKDMKTPPSDLNMYGESRTELRPGIYFWYVEV
jgi:hypothetical protein